MGHFNLKSPLAIRSLTIALGYGDLTLGGAVLDEVKSLRIVGVTLDSKFTFEFVRGKLCQRQPGV